MISLETLNVVSTDVFVSYRCGLRCTHCFLGDLLNTSQDMVPESLARIIQSCSSWGSTEITFLGGEPTLYPHLADAVKLARREGLRPRIVTNGQGGFARFVKNDEMLGTHVCISIDGSCADTHDAIRGHGAFDRLLQNVADARNRGFQMSGILSISRANAHDTYRMLALCAALELDYVNLHYVSSRGNATVSSTLNPFEWAEVCVEIERAAANFPALEIRYERTFVPEQAASGECAVRDGSNLMFLPDGRVFACMMFIDVPDAHAYEWDGWQLRERPAHRTELQYVEETTGSGCPALEFVNPGTVSKVAPGHCVECIYAKSRLNEHDRVSPVVLQ